LPSHSLFSAKTEHSLIIQCSSLSIRCAFAVFHIAKCICWMNNFRLNFHWFRSSERCLHWFFFCSYSPKTFIGW
jgi:hypothetical protein